MTLVERGAHHGKRSHHATACSNVGGVEGKCIAGCLSTELHANDAGRSLAYARVRKKAIRLDCGRDAYKFTLQC